MDRRKISIFVIILVILGLGIVGWYYNSRPDEKVAKRYITYRDPKLTDEEKKPFLERIKTLQDSLGGLSGDDKKTGLYQAYLGLASEYFPIGELEKSRQYYEKAYQLYPDQSLPWYAAANVEVSMENYDDANAHYAKAVSLQPQIPEYWRESIALISDKFSPDREKIEALYKEALERTHDNVDIITVYAKFLTTQGRLEEAVRQWKKAMEKNPDGKPVYEQEINDIRNRLQ